MKRFFLFLFTLFVTTIYAGENLLRVLQTTDIHGEAGFCSHRPGMIRAAVVIKREREEAGTKNTLLIDCGDVLQGTFFAASDGGAGMVDALNCLQYDIWVPGNHDFDFGSDNLIQRMKSFHGTILAANLELEGGHGLYRSWAMFHRAGKKIAVIGCVPPYLNQWIAPGQLKGVSTVDIEESVARVMPEINQAKPDLIILAMHGGRFSAGRLQKDGKAKHVFSLTKRFPQIRLILGGHTHETVPFDKLWPDSVYMQCPALGMGVAEANLRFGDKLEIQTRVFPLTMEDVPEPTMKAFFAQTEKKIEQQMTTPVAKVPVSLEPQKAKVFSPLAKMLADSMRLGTGADAAFCSTVSNFSAHPGKLTEKELFLLAPYENYIQIVTLTEDQTKALIEEQLALPVKVLFLHASGIEYDTDDAKLHVKGKIRVNGTPWPEGKKMQIALSSYAASGAGGRYQVLRALSQAHGKSLPLTLRDLFREYLSKKYPYQDGRETGKVK